VLGFGGGERSRDKLGFGCMVARVGDEGAVTEMFRSMMVPPWGGAKASYWLIPAPPLAGTLQTGYPRVQDSSQDKERNVQPRTATCLATSEHASQPRWDPRLPHVQWLRSPPLRGRALAPPCVP
jgi:hypothetical protein